ncbi:DM13 domain-containing protein [uncultured Shewanella sp.]|uniref:DM13 domain-containing protein n=1 Tax=uncultured Shewanella sp. TaxID=173975 RepID=UPI0026091E69|nr:DM13 domain-containing protein [uncultured Shewanella sp.]
MKIRMSIVLIVTHLFVGGVGFLVGIYALPILTAPTAPAAEELAVISANAQYRTEFKKNLKGSDLLHWGEGQVFLSPSFITLKGTLAPGPNYMLYLSPTFVETEDDFNRLKARMISVGDVRTFNNFVVKVPPNIDLSQYNSLIIWCEAFGEFITSAKYR